MSVESMAIALHHSRAKGTPKLVLLGIANHDGDGGAWPSVATLSKYAGGVDKRNVQRAVDELERLGEVRRLVSEGGTHLMADYLRPNLYQFLLSCPPDCDRSKNHKTRRDTVVPELFTPAAETPPGGAPAGGGVAEPPSKPSLNHPLQDREVKSSGYRARESSERYVELVRAKCPSRGSVKPHRFEASGYCTFCGIRQGEGAS